VGSTPTRFDECWWQSPLRWLAAPLWLATRPTIALRGALFDHRWRTVRRLPVPVLSVGNLTVGGTGKTPLVAWLVDWCRARGQVPAVISRGYRALPGGGNDEARLFDCAVECDADRHAGGRRAIAAGATCLILDDGFQHRRLHRDADLVVVDALRPFGPTGRVPAVLPLGMLREPIPALRRADAILINRSDQLAAASLLALETRLAGIGRPLLRMRQEAVALRALDGGGERPPAALAGQPVLLASGLGNPAGFTATAAALGWQVRGHRRFPDHHHYTSADARDLLAAVGAAGATLVVTAKDAVKLVALLPGTAPCLVLHVRAVVDAAGLPALETLLRRVVPVR